MIVELKDSKWLPDIGMHCIECSDNMGTVVCLKIELLPDYYPLSMYHLHSLSLVPLHHSIACTMWCVNKQMDELFEKVKVVLPNLPADICNQVKLTFEEHGASWSHIGLLSAQHLVPPLKTVQCVKLLRAVKTETGYDLLLY